VDTFEYRLLREKEFRQSITRREAGEADAEIPAQPTQGPIAPPQIGQKARNSKLLEGSDATFTAKISANPPPRVSAIISLNIP
jgi:titin